MSNPIKLPPKPTRGSQITAAWAAMVVDAIAAGRWASSPSLRVNTTPSGTTGEVVGPARGGAALPPWTMNGIVEPGGSPVYKIKFRPGMVRNKSRDLIPMISGVSLIAAVPAALTVTGSSGFTYLRATVDGDGAITDLEILGAAALPADTSTYKHRLIGIWAVYGGAFTLVETLLNTHQLFRMCGSDAEWY